MTSSEDTDSSELELLLQENVTVDNGGSFDTVMNETIDYRSVFTVYT